MTTAASVDLQSLVVDGVVRVGSSLFPVDVTVGSFGTGKCRFILAERPEGGWVAGAWVASGQGSNPREVVLGDVERLVENKPRRIQLVLTSGDIVQVTPSVGCACGGQLRVFNPFGPNVSLASVPTPKVPRVS